ncbi:MAG: BON domain-containing protein [Planctomycetes bacterium]|nr:BON domain-containing protein [Planctomycetota bacterium]
MKTRLLATWGILSALGLLAAAGAARAQTTTPSSTTTTTAPTNFSQLQSSSTNTSTQAIQIKLKINASSSGNGLATGIPSTYDFNAPWYGDPLSMGLPSQWQKGPPSVPQGGPVTGSKVTFGQGIYVPTTTATAAAASTAASQANGFTTVGIVRNPQYGTVLSDQIPLVVHTDNALHSTIKSALDRSTRIKSKAGVQVVVSGATVELRGQVASDTERLVIEGMVRMTPGVRDVLNELKVAGK